MALDNESLNLINSDDNEDKHSSLKTIKKAKTGQKTSKTTNSSGTSRKTSSIPKSQVNYDSEGEDPFVDSNLPYHGFCYKGGSYEYRRMNHLSERQFNNSYYNRTKCLEIIPFLYDQPEGMPCFIRKLDDIVNMSKENVLIFLRGYDEPTDDADLNELRRRLAIAVGVPTQTANKEFNYVNKIWESLNKPNAEDDQDGHYAQYNQYIENDKIE